MEEIVMHIAEKNDQELLVKLLRDADEDEQVIRKYLANPACVSYFANIASHATVPLGAATILWSGPESEIIYIAIQPELRNQGYGKLFMAKLIQEARKRQIGSLLIGTDNTALENILFYQKCGFRMDHVRSDYFNYIQPPVFHNGLQIRDMLVLKHNLG
jgi:GNAT superfamily N-acetyltransferase